MANNDPSQYWTYDANRRDHYHAEWRGGRWEYTWASESNIPRTPYVNPPGEQHRQESDPHRTRPPSAHTGGAEITQAFNRLNVRGSQPPHGNLQRSGPSSFSQPGAAAAPPRSESSGQRGSFYSARSPSVVIEPNRTIRPAGSSSSASHPKFYVSHQLHGPLSPTNVAYGDSEGRSPFQGVGRTAGKLPAQGYQTQWPSAEQIPQAQHASLGYPRESRVGGSSHAAYPSNTSYQSPPGLGDSLTVALRSDRLNPKEFKQITHKRKKFFVVGKVFMIYYIENAGETADRGGHGGTNFTTVAHGEVAHHQFRRFVVVKEMSDQNFCYCCPITTYGGRATTKPGVDQVSHTIVYSGRNPPEKLPGETQMNKEPLRINLCSPDDKLDPRSRINLGREHPIDHNHKVKNIGDVDERSLPKLVQYRKAVRDR